MILAKLLVLIFLSQSGAIEGYVYDAVTGQGLPYANVVIEGTKLGSATDVNGYYTILNVPPGKYRVRASILGYKDKVQEVSVGPGEIKKLDFYLSEAVIQLKKEIVVVGKKPLIEKEVSSTRAIVEQKEIEAMTVENVREVLQKQAGVSGQGTDIHIRGSRSNEMTMYVDGIPVKDPLSGNAFGLYLPAKFLKSYEVIFGGISAEYGNVTAGVIRAEIREGTSKFHAGFMHKRDDFGFARYFGFEEYSLYLQGPIRLGKLRNLRYFASFDATFNNTYLPHTENLFSSVYGTDRLSPKEENNLAGVFKVSWKPRENIKLFCNFTKSIEINQGFFYSLADYPFAHGFPTRYMYYLDHYPVFTRDANQSVFGLHYVLNLRNIFDLRLSRFFTNFHLDVQGKRWDEYVAIGDFDPPFGYYDHGDAPYWHDHYAESYVVRFDFTRQQTPVWRVKTGFLLNYSNVQWIDIQYPWLAGPSGLGLNYDIYRAHTTRGGIYIQNNIHFAGMIAALGLRLDFWVPGMYVERGVKRSLQRFDLHPVIRSQYEEYLSAMKVPFTDYHFKAHLNPRIGVSFPVTERTKFHFSYTHSSKIPDFKYVYSKLGRRATSTYTLVGNPNLKPTVTVQYELGLEHLITERVKFSSVAYYKDIFNYPTATRVPGIPPNPDFWMYLNSDYARAFGVENGIKGDITNHLSISATLTLSQATGKASTSEDVYWRRGEESLKEWHLKWSRPFKLFTRLTYRTGKEPSMLWKIPVPDHFLLSISWSLQSGVRYTPVDSLGNYGEYNSRLGPTWSRVDVKIKKTFRTRAGRIKLELEGKNILNAKLVRYVNPLTGRAYEPGDPIPPGFRVRDLNTPARYMAPRQIKLGVSLEW